MSRPSLPENREYAVFERWGNCFPCRDLAEAQEEIIRAFKRGTAVEDLAVTMGEDCFSAWSVLLEVYHPRKMPEWVEEWGWEEC